MPICFSEGAILRLTKLQGTVCNCYSGGYFCKAQFSPDIYDGRGMLKQLVVHYPFYEAFSVSNTLYIELFVISMSWTLDPFIRLHTSMF